MWISYAEADLSAEKAKTSKNPRFSRTNAYKNRPTRPEGPAQKRPKAAGLNMLQNIARLRTARDHGRVRRFGRQAGDHYLNVKALQTENNQTRLAIVVSKRVDRRAVARNRLKRQLRALVVRHHAGLRPNADIIILTRPAVASLSFETMGERLTALLRRLNLLR